MWTPGAIYNGSDKFTQNVFAALNSLYGNIEKDGAGNVKTKEAEGNVNLDFVNSKSNDVNIFESKNGSMTSEDGKQIFWNPEEGIHVTKGNDDIEGDISAATLLAHEFGHAWLSHYSPTLNNLMENFKGSFGNNDPENDTWILPNVELKFASSRKEGIRRKYNQIVNSKEELYKGKIQLRNNSSNLKIDYKIKSK